MKSQRTQLAARVVVAIGFGFAVGACSSSSNGGADGGLPDSGGSDDWRNYDVQADQQEAASDTSTGGSGGSAGSGGTAGTAGSGGQDSSAGGSGGVAGSDAGVDSGDAGGAGGSAPSWCNIDAGACNLLEEIAVVQTQSGTCKMCVSKSVQMPPVTTDAGTFTYSIDATETTYEQYSTWLLTNPSLSILPSFCITNVDGGVWKTSFSPGGTYETGTSLPVAYVDWCDAYGYCQAIGKRLCGKIGGGTNNFADYANATTSQWYNACSSGGVDAYPYGQDYQAQSCNCIDRSGSGNTTAITVGSLSTCQSLTTGFSGVYDLSGNVWEWEDSYSSASGQNDFCRMRGGSFVNTLGMECGYDSNVNRNYASLALGIRCCSAP